MASVEKAKEELTQRLIEEREAKDRELREIRKRMAELEEQAKKTNAFFDNLHREALAAREDALKKYEELHRKGLL